MGRPLRDYLTGPGIDCERFEMGEDVIEFRQRMEEDPKFAAEWRALVAAGAPSGAPGNSGRRNSCGAGTSERLTAPGMIRGGAQWRWRWGQRGAGGRGGCSQAW